MKSPYLTAEIYRDVINPELSIEPALHGIDIVRGVAPWIKVQKQSQWALDGVPDGPIDVDEVVWPQTDADIAIVLTRRTLLGIQTKEQQRAQSVELDFLGGNDYLV